MRRDCPSSCLMMSPNTRFRTGDSSSGRVGHCQRIAFPSRSNRRELLDGSLCSSDNCLYRLPAPDAGPNVIWLRS
jgi:hypothetical protein